MLWLKRNLFVAVGGLITLVLVGFGIYYMLNNIQENKSIESSLEEKKDQLDKISRKDPFPSKENIENVRGQTQKMRDGMNKMKAYFSPVPVQRVMGKEFADLLANTLDELHKKANQLNVTMPGRKYAFSFEAQKDKLTFGRGSFPDLPEQLAQIKTVVQILLDAKINRLVNIRRAPVSQDDEMQKSLGDYHTMPIITNGVTGAVCRPYQFEFECFSSELATVMENLQKSKYALVVKLVAADPAAAPAPGSGLTPGMGSPVNPIPTAPQRPYLPRRPGVGGVAAPAPGAAAAATAAEIKTVLAERLLKVVMVVEVIQPGK